MRIAILTLILLSGLSIPAASGEGLFIVKLNGDTVFGASEIKERFFSPNMLYINGDSLPARAVAVMKTEQGYFRRPEEGYGKEDFALRVFDGRIIDKYSLSVSTMAPVTLGEPGMGRMSVLSGGTGEVSLYSKAEGPLREIDYDNVKMDFWDYPASQAMIRTYERRGIYAWVGLAIGLVVPIASSPLSEKSRTVGAIMGGVGLTGLGTALYNFSTRKKFLFKAVERYREE